MKHGRPFSGGCLRRDLRMSALFHGFYFLLWNISRGPCDDDWWLYILEMALWRRPSGAIVLQQVFGFAQLCWGFSFLPSWMITGYVNRVKKIGQLIMPVVSASESATLLNLQLIVTLNCRNGAPTQSNVRFSSLPPLSRKMQRTTDGGKILVLRDCSYTFLMCYPRYWNARNGWNPREAICEWSTKTRTSTP